MELELLRKNTVLRLSFEFAVLVLKYCELLEQSKKYVIAKQLLRSATSIGANAIEAQNAESKTDFIHKMKIAAKEADETQFWLLICKESGNYPDCSFLLERLNNIQKLLNRIIRVSKERYPSKGRI
jgi:four helix bundle protein